MCVCVCVCVFAARLWKENIIKIIQTIIFEFENMYLNLNRNWNSTNHPSVCAATVTHGFPCFPPPRCPSRRLSHGDSCSVLGCWHAVTCDMSVACPPCEARVRVTAPTVGYPSLQGALRRHLVPRLPPGTNPFCLRPPSADTTPPYLFTTWISQSGCLVLWIGCVCLGSLGLLGGSLGWRKQ